MEETLQDWNPRKSIRRLTESIRCLLGLKRGLDSKWVESVCHIIENLLDDRYFSDTEVTTRSPGEMGLYHSAMDEFLRKKIQGDIEALGAHLSQLELRRRQSLNELLDLKGNIRVFCRIRPFLNEEKTDHMGTVIASDSDRMLLKITENKRKQYDFDGVFNPGVTEGEVFSEIEPVIKSALGGYNVCIFAYGQTGTGKTHTMEGTSDCHGVVPRAFDALFKQALHGHREIHFTFSMLEIYMGNLRDLLNPPKGISEIRSTSPCLSIKSDANGGIEIENLTAIKVCSSKQLKKLYRLGGCLRTTASTMSNVTSSRSHCLVRITMASSNDPQRIRETNKIWMVDLGGSERLFKTQARGRRLKEGKFINLSLCALGDVISALQRRKAHIPYRNSKLTQILKDSLGEDSKTLMLVHISPREEDLCETVCSLGFATRVRSIHLGHEESKEQKAIKEAQIVALQNTISRVESEFQDTRREISRLMEMLKAWDRTETLNANKSNSPCPTDEGQIGNCTLEPNYGDPKLGCRLLPGFMRPTISSKLKTGAEQPNNKKEKKTRTRSKRRKASSLYADSITSKLENRSLEHSLECSISRFESSSCRNSAYSAAQCTEDASERETEAAIFPEDKIQGDALASISSGNSAEHGQEHPKGEKNHLKLDDWSYSQEADVRTTCNLPMISSTFPDRICGAFNSEVAALDHRVGEDIDPDFNPGYSCGDLGCSIVASPSKQLDSMPTTCVSSNSEDPHQNYTSDYRVEQVGDVSETQRQIENYSHLGDEECSDESAIVKQERTKTPDESSVVYDSKAYGGNPRLSLRRSRRALLLANGLPVVDQKNTTCYQQRFDNVTTKVGMQTGYCRLLGQIILFIFTNALFALGLRNIGLGDEFYHGLTS